MDFSLSTVNLILLENTQPGDSHSSPSSGAGVLLLLTLNISLLPSGNIAEI